MSFDMSSAQAFMVFGSGAAATLALLADNYTTMIALQHGMVEGNPLIRWMFKKVGTSFTAFLCGGTILIAGAAMTNYGAAKAATFFGIIAVGEGIRALLNYRKLKALKISLN